MTNFIQCTSGALSQQECDAVIDFFENNKERQVADTIGGRQIDDPLKKDITRLEKLQMHLT